MIELLQRNGKPMRLVAIERVLKIPHTSAHSILSEMVDLDLLLFDLKSRTYALARKLGHGESLSHANDFEGAFVRRVGDLADDIGEVVSLNTVKFIFTESVVTALPQSRAAPYDRPTGNVGGPICQTVSGHVLLGQATDAHVLEIVRSTNRWARVTRAGFSFQAADVLRHARAARRDGHAIDVDNWRPGLGVIAVPVPGLASDRQWFTLSTSGEGRRIWTRREKILKALKAAAVDLGRRRSEDTPGRPI